MGGNISACNNSLLKTHFISASLHQMPNLSN